MEKTYSRRIRSFQLRSRKEKKRWFSSALKRRKSRWKGSVFSHGLVSSFCLLAACCFLFLGVHSLFFPPAANVEVTQYHLSGETGMLEGQEGWEQEFFGIHIGLGEDGIYIFREKYIMDPLDFPSH